MSPKARSVEEIDTVLSVPDGDLPESDVPPHTPLLEVRGLGKRYSGVTALSGITATVNSGEVTCVLGDNGAGKSTFIKILTGVVSHDSGQYFVGGKRVRFNSPRQALDRGIAAVYQDNALVPALSIWRNFFLGSEPTRGIWPFRRLYMEQAKETTVAELGRFGLEVRDPGQRVSSLSAGERQAVAIARALYFGARVLILDEPTAALGVVQAGIVLRQITGARERGIGVVFITHNPRQAYPVGDRFLLLNHGAMVANVTPEDVDLAGLTQLMAGGADLDELTHEG
ncbi:MAG: sugar ABC transporter ATP-binding protein [Geodermatophilaceae bacterium]|nr:sugar ABC transporter ATP-binding protein [Geodermatophilaceae bacterium]